MLRGWGLLLWKVGVCENTPRLRCTIHTHTQHTQQFLQSHHASTGPHVSLFCFCLFQHHIIRNNNHKWVKNCRRQIPSKKRKLNKMGYHSKCNKKYSIFLEPHWKFMTDITHFFGPSHLRDAGQSISICLPRVCDSLHSEVAISSLDYKPHFSKHGVNRIPWRAWRAGQECTALHTNWSWSRERYWQATVATGLGQTHRPDCSHSLQLGTLGLSW